MKPASTDSENSDDELDIELKRYLKIGRLFSLIIKTAHFWDLILILNM